MYITKKLTPKTNLLIETLAGIKELKLYIKDNKVEKVMVNMGKPIFNSKEIPVISNESVVKNIKIKVLDKDFKFTCVLMGNPHAITIVEDITDCDVEKYGKILEVR